MANLEPFRTENRETEPDAYEFIRISPELYDDFRGLVEASFEVLPSRDEVTHLFDTTAFGADHVGFMAYHRKSREPAAFYGIYPCFVELDGKRFLAAQSGSTMTHPDHRKKNLFFHAGIKTFELARELEVAFVFGFPNRFSYRGLMKLGWTHDGDIVRYRIVVPTVPIGFLASLLPGFSKLHTRLFRKLAASRCVPAYHFRSSSLESGVGGMHRSEDSLRYKPAGDNRMMLNIGGSAVWINLVGGQIGIGDVELAERPEDFTKLLRQLKWLAFLSGCSVIRTYVSPDSRLDRMFGSHGYSGSKALANCYLDLTSEVDPSRFKWVYADFDTF